MPSTSCLLLTIGLACTAVASPVVSKKCVTTVKTTFEIYDILSSVQGVSCVGPAFNFIRSSQASTGCQDTWTTCFLDKANKTALISGPDGPVGFVPHSRNLTSSAKTAPAVFTYSNPTPGALTPVWYLTLDGNELSVSNLDSPVLKSIPAPNALNALVFQVFDTYLLDHE